MLIKKIIFISLCGFSFLFSQNSLLSGLGEIVAKAEEQKAEESKVLNNAFKQRMKTQRMARDTLLIRMDFNRTLYQKKLREDADGFNTKFLNLIDSKKEIALVVKKLPEFAKKIERFKSIWSAFYQNIKQLEQDADDKKAVQYIIDNNLKVLEDIDYIFSNFIKFYQSSDKLEKSMTHIKTMLFTQVGKPRMYISKIVKERLLIKQNIDKEANQKRLQESIENMDRLMKALKEGDKKMELHGTEDRKILEKLTISQQLWEETKLLVKKEKLSKEDVAKLIEKNDKFIEAHTVVVKLSKASFDN
jgi:hypothetical protein